MLRLRNIITATAFIFLSSTFVYAQWSKPKLAWLQYYRYDMRNVHNQLYVNRISISSEFSDKSKNPLFKAGPFCEFRRNVNKDVWERVELGVEVGKDIFSWLYAGEIIQAAWLHEAYRNYSNAQERKTVESETRLLLTHRLLENKAFCLNGFILDEFTYDFRIGAGVRNEVAVGISSPLTKHIEAGLNWRHIDRIRDYDSDNFEVSLKVLF